MRERVSSVRLTVPKAPWTMFISGAALVLKIQKMEPDGSRGYFMLVDEKAEVFASLFIEPVNKCKNSKECRIRDLGMFGTALGAAVGLGIGIGEAVWAEMKESEAERE